LADPDEVLEVDEVDVVVLVEIEGRACEWRRVDRSADAGLEAGVIGQVDVPVLITVTRDAAAHEHRRET